MAQGGQQIAIKSGAIRAVFMSFIFDFVHNFVNFILIQTTKRLAIKITTVEQGTGGKSEAGAWIGRAFCQAIKRRDGVSGFSECGRN